MRFITWCFLSIFLISFPFFNLIAFENPQETITISGTDTVYIIGWIGPGIEEYFKSLDPTKIKKVHLFSSGGKLYNAINIANIVRAYNMETYVGEQGQCYSACTIIFQAGKIRTAHSSAMFLYHYAYDRFGPKKEIIKINERSTAVMFRKLIEYGISPFLIAKVKANKGTDIEVGIIEALRYRIVTKIQNKVDK